MSLRSSNGDTDGDSINLFQADTRDLVIMLDPSRWDDSPLRDALAAKYKVARMQMARYNLLRREDGPRQVQEVAELLISAIGRMAPEEKYTLVAGSAAATVALWITLLAPEAVEALVLISPVAVLPAGNPVTAKPEQLVASLENVDGLLQLETDQTEALSALIRGGIHDSELEDRLEEVSCATLAIFGLSDRMISPEAPRVYRQKIPNSNICLVYDAGHAIVADRPESLINTVMDFIERRDAFVVGHQSSVINP